MHTIRFLTGLVFIFIMAVCGTAAWAPFKWKSIRKHLRARKFQAAADRLHFEYWDERQYPPYQFPLFDLAATDVLFRGRCGGADVYVGRLELPMEGMIIRNDICFVEDPAIDFPAFLLERPYPHNWIESDYLIPYRRVEGTAARVPCLDRGNIVHFRNDIEFHSMCRLLCEDPNAGRRLFSPRVRDFLWNNRGFSAIAGFGHVFFVSYFAAIAPQSLVQFTDLTLKLHFLFQTVQRR